MNLSNAILIQIHKFSLPLFSEHLQDKAFSMADNIPNDVILQQLSLGTISFEIHSSQVPLVCRDIPRSLLSFETTYMHGASRFFARIGSAISGGVRGPAMKRVQHYSVQTVTGDGRCLFRALVKGMALKKGVALNPREETENADELRMAVKDVICGNDQVRLQYENAVVAITAEESLTSYCERIGRPDFWGGEAELLVLSKLCSQHIIVYIPEHEHRGSGTGFIPIQEYGADLCEGSRKSHKALKLLYTGNNHYDLLV